MSTTYHEAVKRVYSMSVWMSNHDGYKIAKVHIFKHLSAKRRETFMYSLLNSDSPCVLSLRNYFQLKSVAIEWFREYFLQKYQLSDVLSNPLCAVISRIGDELCWEQWKIILSLSFKISNVVLIGYSNKIPFLFQLWKDI